MEFNFNITDIFNQPIVEINRDLIPPGFRGDRRTLWNTVNRVSEVVNALGEASASAQGLPKPITTSERLKNSEHKLYLLVDQNANGGRGAVHGMLRTGAKGLYVFDKTGQHYQVSPPCLLDFYIHESNQRRGLGRQLFEHMLYKEQVDPGKMAIDRPSEKLMSFLKKHYGLTSPMKQMNNYVVFESFFPKRETQIYPQETPNKKFGLSRKESANGLQSGSSAFGRYERNSIGKLHNDPEDRTRNITSTPILNHCSPVTHVRESQSTPNYPNQPADHYQKQEANTPVEQQGYSSQQTMGGIPQHSQNQYSMQSRVPNRTMISSPEIPCQNQMMHHQEQYPNNLQGMQSLPQIKTDERVNPGLQLDAQSNPQFTTMNAVHPQKTELFNSAPTGQQYSENPPENIQSRHEVVHTDSSLHQQNQPHVNSNQSDRSGGYSPYQAAQATHHYPQAVSNNQVGMSPQNPAESAPAAPDNQTGLSTQNQFPQGPVSHYDPGNSPQQAQMMPRDIAQYQQHISTNNNSVNTNDMRNQQLNHAVSQNTLQQSPELPTNNHGTQQMPMIHNQKQEVSSDYIQNTYSNQGTANTDSRDGNTAQHQMLAHQQNLIQNSGDNTQNPQAEQDPAKLIKNQAELAPQAVPNTTFGSQSRTGVVPAGIHGKSSAVATNISPEQTTDYIPQKSVTINPLDSRNMSNPNYISQVQYNPLQKTPVASRTTVPMEEGVLEYGYPPQLSKAQALHFQKPNTMIH